MYSWNDVCYYIVYIENALCASYRNYYCGYCTYSDCWCIYRMYSRCDSYNDDKPVKGTYICGSIPYITAD